MFSRVLKEKKKVGLYIYIYIYIPVRFNRPDHQNILSLLYKKSMCNDYQTLSLEASQVPFSLAIIGSYIWLKSNLKLFHSVNLIKVEIH